MDEKQRLDTNTNHVRIPAPKGGLPKWLTLLASRNCKPSLQLLSWHLQVQTSPAAGNGAVRMGGAVKSDDAGVQKKVYPCIKISTNNENVNPYDNTGPVVLNGCTIAEP